MYKGSVPLCIHGEFRLSNELSKQLHAKETRVQIDLVG